MSMAEDVLRSRDGLVESYVLVASHDAFDDLIAAVRDHWKTLRARKLAAATPVQVLASSHREPATVTYTFKWQSAESRIAAQQDPDVAACMLRIENLATEVTRLPELNEAHQGFDWQKFPDRGGLELLKGVCNCVVRIDGIDVDVPLNAINGFVLMHRAPGRDVDADGSREMYVSIIDHG